jgi:hypothetical protein
MSVLNDHHAAGEKKGLRISYVFGGLVGLGMLVTIYGLYVDLPWSVGVGTDG